MKSISHYLDTLESTDTVGPQLLAKAVYAGRHGSADDATPDDLRPIVRDLPNAEVLPTDRARRLLAAQLLRSAASKDPRDYDPRRELKGVRLALDIPQREAAEKIGVHQVTWARWESDDPRTPGDVERGAMLDWADELESK